MKKIFTIIFVIMLFIASENVQAKSILSVEEELNSLTLEEKIGQMIMIGVYGTEINDDIKFLLNTYNFGGIILYDRNLESLEQTKKFSDELKNFGGKKIPLLIAIDQEGGVVARGKNFLEIAPSQEEIGKSGDLNNATYCAKHNAKTLRSIGVNLKFAPVADIGTDRGRSFGKDPQLVSKFINAAANGYEEENFLYTLKHFPGLGRSNIDTHIEVSNVTVDKDALDAVDLQPFKKIIQDHDNTRFMIMIGHLKYDALDPTTSASLSPKIITDLLRNELKFDGVVITDDLAMGAIKNHISLEELGPKLIKAGGDIALLCHNNESQQVIYKSILEAVRRGEISEERINESVRRILKLKEHLNENLDRTI